MPLVRLPDDKPTHATLDVAPPADRPWATARDLLRSILAAWPTADRGELAALADDDGSWGVLGWEQSSGDDLDLDDESPEHWDDLLELDAPLPDPLPPHLALTLTSSTMKLTFASIPSIADGSTHVVRCLPWSTAATLVEDVCDRHGLVRRLTLGGETRSRGKDKWGGGTPVEYVLEELWADGRGLELNFAVQPEAFVAALVDQPLYESPFPDAVDVVPTYRFCIPETWLLRSPHPRSTAPPAAASDGAPPDEEDSTVKNARSDPDAAKAAQAHGSSGSAPGSASKRYSLLGSILGTFIAPTAGGASEPVVGPPPARPAALKKRSGIDRMSVSEPLAAASPAAASEPSAAEAGRPPDDDGVEEIEDDEHWEALFDRFAVKSPEAQARIRNMPPQKRAELFNKTGPSAASLSRGTSGNLRRGSIAGGPPTSFKAPDLADAPRLEPQRTGDSAGVSKRFSIASLAGWGDADDGPLPLAKQDTGGWSAWWSGSKNSGQDPYLVSAVKELSLSTTTNMKIRTTLGSLSRTLASAPKEVCEAFIGLRGVDAIRKVLVRLVLPPIQEKGELASQSILEILHIIQSVMRYGGITHYAIISDAELMMLLALASGVPSYKVGTVVSRLLTGLAVLPDTLNATVVLEAFSAGRLVTGDRFRFQRLVDSLGPSEDWDGADQAYSVDEHRYCVLLLVGRLCAAFVADVEARVLLRDEFDQAGLKERIVSIRYAQPPERIVDCFEDWKEETERDRQELIVARQSRLDRLADSPASGSGSDVAPGLASALDRLRQLAGLLRDAEELAPTTDGILRSLTELVGRDTDAFTKDTILDVLNVCAQHIAGLDDSSDWRSAVRGIVAALSNGADGSDLSDSSTEVDLLHTENDALREEVRSLQEVLRQREVEETVFKELPPNVSESFGSSANLTKQADGNEVIANQGLIIRLVQKEKDLAQLRMELDRLSKSTAKQAGKETDDKARRERERAKDVKHKSDIEASFAKARRAEQENQEIQAALAFTRRALETVHARFSALSTADAPSGAPAANAHARPEILATEVINSLARKEDEIRTLRAEVAQLRQQVTARKRMSQSSASLQEEKHFKARVAPPPPPPPSARHSIVIEPRPADAAPAPTTETASTPPISACPSPPPIIVSTPSASPPSSVVSPTPLRTASPLVPAGLPDVRSALFAAIRTRPTAAADDDAVNEAQGSTRPPPPPPADSSALMAALRGRAIDAPAPAASPPAAALPSLDASSSAPAADAFSAASDPRAALMAALRGRPSETTPAPHAAEDAPSPAVDPRAALMAALRAPSSRASGPSSTALPTSPLPPGPVVLTPSANGTGAPQPDLRAALMAGIRKGASGNGGVSTAPPAPRPAPPAPPPSKKLKPFFWKKLAQTDVQATIWGDMPAEILSLDLLELEQTFSLAPPKPAASQSPTSRKPQAITLLDISRSNNIGILLAKLKLPIPKISQAILVFDDETLSLDDLKSLSRLLPTAEESSRIAAFEDLSKLAKPDLYFKEIGRIPRLQIRLECMLFRRRLELDLQELLPDLEALASARRELQSSVKFKKVLQIVLCIGNALNTATFRGGASGFEMEALLKLRETRTARAECPTLLHFVARTIVKTSPGLALFIEDMPSVSAAARINVATINQSVAQIAAGVSKINTETALLRASPDKPSNDRFAPVMEAFVARVEPEVGRVQALGVKVNRELADLLVYFGEKADGPDATRPEDFFGMVLTFSMSLQNAAAEVTKHLALKPPTSSPLQKRTNAILPSRTQSSSHAASHPPSAAGRLLAPAQSGPSAAPGELDAAIRSLHHSSAARTRRAEHERTQREQQRPLSKIFYDGAGGGGGGTTKTVCGGGTTVDGGRGEGTAKAGGEQRRSLGSMFNE